MLLAHSTSGPYARDCRDIHSRSRRWSVIQSPEVRTMIRDRMTSCSSGNACGNIATQQTSIPL